MSLERQALEAVLPAHQRYLWGLCYRMTGNAADAEDLVQETFRRALEKPPANVTDPLRPWLARIAVNLSHDALKRRRELPYDGMWLPSPIDTGDESSPPGIEPQLAGGATTEGRYDLLESVSYAFLLALEALTPQQRAVLLLRDVFDYSVREVAECLALTEANVKTTHHRARSAMADYDRARCVPTTSVQRRTREALEGLMGLLLANDVRGIENALASSVRAVSDSAGRFRANKVPVVGAARVAHFFVRLMELRGQPSRAHIVMLNGLPAVVASWPESPDPMLASRTVIRIDLDAEGKIAAVHGILAPDKLTAVPFDAPA